MTDYVRLYPDNRIKEWGQTDEGTFDYMKRYLPEGGEYVKVPDGKFNRYCLGFTLNRETMEATPNIPPAPPPVEGQT